MAVEDRDGGVPATGQLGSLVVRGGAGGLLMGLANLVPGISGGTMLLAVGIYPQFIGAIAEVTTLRFRMRSLILLGAVGITAVLAIALFAGPLVKLVLNHRWIMYSLFIGLTLGGVPLLLRMLRGSSRGAWIGAGIGFTAMAALAYVQAQGAGASGGGDQASMILLFVAGIAGASAMILPGISGGYLLLVLGCYIPVLTGIDRFKNALKAVDVSGLVSVSIDVIIPLGVGVVVGVVGVSHLVKLLLDRFEQVTLGVLLGLLLGAVLGLWPFHQLVPLDQVQAIKNQTVVVVDEQLQFRDSGKWVKPKDYPTTYRLPSGVEAAGALGLVGLGLGFTLILARVSARREETEPVV